MTALANTALKNDSTSSFTPRKLRCFVIFCLVFAAFVDSCKGLTAIFRAEKKVGAEYYLTYAAILLSAEASR